MMRNLLFTLMVVLLASTNLAAQDDMEVTPTPTCEVIEYETYVNFVFTCEEPVDELNVYVYRNNQYQGSVGGPYPWGEGIDGPICIYTVERTDDTQQYQLLAQALTYGKEPSYYLEINYTVGPIPVSGQTAPPVIGERYEPEPAWGMMESHQYYDSYAITLASGDDEEATVYYRYHYVNEWDGKVIESDWKSTLSPLLPSPGVLVDPDLILYESASGWVEAYAVAKYKEPSETVRHEFYFSCYPSVYFQRYYDFVVDGIYYKVNGDGTVAVSKHTVDVMASFDPYSGHITTGTDWEYMDYWTSANPCYSGDVVIPSTVEHNGQTYTVNAINDYAFECCDLNSLQLPGTLTTIGSCAFFSSTIPELTIPESVTELSVGALAQSDGLTSIVLPESLTEIPEAAFFGSEGLTQMVLPASLARIGWLAFAECYNLTSVELPASLTEIEGNAFLGCLGLMRVISHAVTPPAADMAFYMGEGDNLPRIYDQATLFVPNESLEAYRNDLEWGQFMHIVPFIGAGPGDVDGDGQIVITDVIGMISLVSSGAELPAYCDVNGDGEVNITDITILINMIVMAE